MTLACIERIREHGGSLERWQHQSNACQCLMTFSVYLPPQAKRQRLPVLYWLSGLTCSDDNFRVKAGAQRYAAELGIILVIPDTSPRGANVPDDPNYDLGQAAGFYLNATQEPWATHYQMERYITEELIELIEHGPFPVIAGQRAISGHSMGGHGALVLALRHPLLYRSVSAFAPITHPSVCPWGQKAFAAYLGADPELWATYDATELLRLSDGVLPILIDQGTEDEFLDEQLRPEDLLAVARTRHYPLNFRYQAGYDHSYHFIGSFIGEHLAFHARYLQGS